MLSALLRAGRSLTTGLSSLSTADSILMSYGNFAGRDGAALSGLKTGSLERHRYPFWLSLGENSLQNRQCLCGYATLSGLPSASFYPDYRCTGYPLSTGDDERLLEKFHVVQHLVWLHDTPNEQKCLNNAPDAGNRQ